MFRIPPEAIVKQAGVVLGCLASRLPHTQAGRTAGPLLWRLAVAQLNVLTALSIATPGFVLDQRTNEQFGLF